jgi:6-phosphogluconate dehydrogenase
MQLGMVGLGRMGANMVRRLVKGGHQCVVFDSSPSAVDESSPLLTMQKTSLKPLSDIWLTMAFSCARTRG